MTAVALGIAAAIAVPAYGGGAAFGISLARRVSLAEAARGTLLLRCMLRALTWTLRLALVAVVIVMVSTSVGMLAQVLLAMLG